MSSEYRFSVDQSWGVGSVRQCAGFPGNVLLDGQDMTYCVPLGSQIVCWDIENKERKISFQAHSDLIICLQPNHYYGVILTISYSGEIKLWDKKFKLLLSEKTTFGNAYYGALSGDGKTFVICGGPWKTSFLAVYQFSQAGDGKISFSVIWQQIGVSLAMGDSHATNSLSDVEKEKEREQENESTTYIYQIDGYIIAQFSSSGNVIAIFERYHGNASEVHLYDSNGGIKHYEILDPLGNPKAAIMCTTPCHNGNFAVGFQGGIFVVLKEENLTMKSVFQATGSPQIALWDRNYILAVSYLSGSFSWWTKEGVCMHEVMGGPKDSIMHVNWTAVNFNQALWVAGIMSLSYVELNYTSNDDDFPTSIIDRHSIKYHEVTGCGLDLSNSNLAASGDFTGNVFVWKKDRNEPLYRMRHEMAVRCLAWKNDRLFIGCLDGLIMNWIPSNANISADICLVCVSGVLSFQWSNNKLAIGLENGDLLVYSFSDGKFSNPVEILNQRAHSQTQDGTEIPAEVWSVCWSPCSKMIASASEDQTTCIWNAANGNKLHTLYGHTTAVTSVDWKIMHSNKKDLLATCADDRTVRLIDGISFDTLHVLQLQQLEGWFTLTYLSLNPCNQQCLCTTQNGHIALWDCLTGELLTCSKMHCGSIEGLAWNKDFSEFGTVSSDCVVNIFHIKLCKN